MHNSDIVLFYMFVQVLVGLYTMLCGTDQYVLCLFSSQNVVALRMHESIFHWLKLKYMR